MKLVDMKKKKSKNTLRETKNTAAVPMEDEPAYPWGLELSLDQTSIKKLGIDVENISVGDKVHFFAEAQIQRVSINEHLDSFTKKKEGNADVSIQVQKMFWGKPKQ